MLLLMLLSKILLLRSMDLVRLRRWLVLLRQQGRWLLAGRLLRRLIVLLILR